MSLWRQLKHGIKALINPRAAESEIDEESQHYRNELAASLEAKGMSPVEAQRAARIEIGSDLAVREQVLEPGWENWLRDPLKDAALAHRRLAANPAFTLTTILTLALGIGASATVFTVIDGVLFRPLPYPDSERLVALTHTAPGINLPILRMSRSLYYTYREESRVFENLAIWNGNRSTVTGLAEPEEVPTLFVTHEFLDVLRVRPAIGRGFTSADADPNAVRTVVLANGYWKQHFGGASTALGQSLRIDGNPHEIIGVLPPTFEFLDEKVSLIVPRRLNRQDVRLIQFGESGIGRLKPGVVLDQANADIARCLPLAATKFPMNQGFATNAFIDARISPTIRTLKDHLIGDVGKTLWILMGAAGILLLIAAANVANLMLLRADGRQREFAVRTALGAGWLRLARELLLENLLLGFAGGTCGLALCYAAIRLLPSLNLAQFPRLTAVTIDARTVAFTVAASFVAAFASGLIPVWRYVRPQLLDSPLNAGHRWSSEAKEQRRARSTLVVLQIALATVLLIASGLMYRTFRTLRSVDPGFSSPAEVQAVRVSIPEALIKEPAQVLVFQESILRKFEALSGVSSVAMANSIPMEGGASDPVYASGRDYGTGSVPPVRNVRSITPRFFESISGRVIAGRDLSWDEVRNRAPVAIISENMARELWVTPQAALGKRVRDSLNQEWHEVIGVVADLRDNGIQQQAPTIVYWPIASKSPDGRLQVPRNVEFLIRSPRAGSATFVQDLRSALAAINPNVPLANVRTLESVYNKSLARTSFALLLLAIAGLTALVLGTVGIYGVVAYSVSRRIRDIGIRIALGSTVHGVTRLFIREGLILACVGAVCGLLAALLVTRLMTTLLFGVNPLDPVTYAAVSFGLVTATLLASWLPARRAALVDPIKALRAE